jgi:hypothetical protein
VSRDHADEEDEVIPPEFLSYSERHGLDSRFTLWGTCLMLGIAGLVDGLIQGLAGDFNPLFWLIGVPGTICGIFSLPLYLRYRQRNLARTAAYEQWKSEQSDS